MHRFIFEKYNLITDNEMLVDHKDQNGLNNQKSNLRLCSKKENNSNTKSRENSSSKYLGVSYHKITFKWQASININNKQKYIGLFKTQEEAARAYDDLAKIHHGQFANLNFK